MNRLMLDYFRRWWWLLALAGLLEFRLGWSIANRPQDTFEFWAFQVTCCAGALMLALDLQRGALRPLALLPLGTGKIGRGWWLATVPLPAAGLAALLFLGAGVFCHLHPSHVFPAQRLAMASLFTLVWLGIESTLILNGMRGFGENLGEFFRVAFISCLSILMFFGSMLFFQDASRRPVRSAILLGVGALLTVVGWVRAEQLDLGRAAKVDFGPFGRSSPGRPGLRLTPLEIKTRPGQFRAPAGYGGIPFLLRHTGVLAFAYAAATIALMALLSLWQPRVLPRDAALVVFAEMAGFMTSCLVIVFPLLSVLRHLRFLRTLPVSTTRLAAVVISMMILPVVAVGALAAGIAWPALGTPAALTFLNCYTFVLAPASLCVFLALWRGEGMLAYILLFLTVLGFQRIYGELQISFHHVEVPFDLTGPIAAITVLLAFVLTRLALLRSSHAYRVRASPFGNFPGAGGG